MVAGSLMFILL